MGMLRYLLPILAVLLAVWMSGFFHTEPKLPEIKADDWWGKGPKATDEMIHKFKVDIPVAALKDLTRRLVGARIAEDIEGGNFHYGFQASTLRSIVEYWKDEYDWRAHEAKINSFPQYKTQIEGISVHFLDVPAVTAEGVKPKPLLMLHGWPGSIWEFYKIIPLLTAQGFRVICPSIPGFGFSEEPHKTGFDVTSAARVFHKLMLRLNVSKYYLQGGDFGSLVTTVMAQAYPQEVLGLHVNMVIAVMDLKTVVRHLAYAAFPSWFLCAEDQARGSPLASVLNFVFVEGGYFHLQATKPHTIGFSLNDSPVGLAAYILEKFSTGTDMANKDKADGGLLEKFSLDELLTNVMIYWWSGSVQASVRFYKENILSESDQTFASMPVKVPTGIADFPLEGVFIPEAFARDKYHHVVQYTRMPRGGHFAAFEEPELLAQDIGRFVEKVEKLQQK